MAKSSMATMMRSGNTLKVMQLSDPKIRAKWRLYQARYRARLREKVDTIHPPEPCRRCHRYMPTELAHLKPTTVHSRGRGFRRRGRGFAQRMRDVLQNPEAYVRLCVRCHRGYDAGHHGLELEPAPF